MAPSKLAFFLALNLVLLAAVQGCDPYCPPVVPTPPIGGGSCSINTLKLGVCANVLNLLKLKIGVPANEQCCPLLGGLADLDAAVCLCTAIRANILGIKLNVPIDLTLLLNQCGKKCPANFTCPM
ncbi:cortical cell-delineating protein-like [Hordeum vulgare subsp. vulgare]|uniref:Bifunctional inhibitor/plant lipid transfer protein/seed storage helical domain-containing protein n=1 Tax=Hordeum vulgare subsp. vulgare TaxID=112509 RepID=A0A8I6YN15_HORVV|nr:cortical cell-delineating protein-like [Hordeum vulgare subsp. vulgare]XP_044961946.1 cortical cell-delineating protein-like [Hordeum vulgare subsp. vulgare]